MSEKYLVERTNSYNHQIIDRFYFDTLDELFDYLNKEKEKIFNIGFSSKEIHLYRISKGDENE